MHVVVTGASSGIGEALVREYVRTGASVTMVARRESRMQAIAQSVGGRTQIFARDLSQASQITDWLAPATEHFGPIDVLINNAGVQIVSQLAYTAADDGDWLLQIDLNTPMRLICEVLPHMVKRDQGCIVNIASLAGIAPTPGMVYYNAAKAGLGAASESLRGELQLAKSRVHVLTVYPGPVTTDMANAALDKLDSATANRIPVGNTTTLARRIRKAVQRRKARVIYPWVYTLARHFPGVTRWMMDRYSPLPAKEES